MPPDQPILIIGAGVAGLTLAQGLRLRSIPFRVFERHPSTHSAQGHRIRISQDGQAALSSVLSPQLQALLHRTAADAFPFKPRYIDASKLEYPPLTPTDLDSLAVDRTWLRNLTSLDIQQAIEYGKEFTSYEVADGLVHARFADGTRAQGNLLVGADGVRSRVRAHLQPRRTHLDLERWIAWGRTPLSAALRGGVPADVLSWCMYLDAGANAQAVVEPMTWARGVRDESGGRLPDCPDYVYWVVCTAAGQYADRVPRTVGEKRAFLERVMRAWHPALRLLLSSAALDLVSCAPVWSSKPDIEISSAGGPDKLVTLVGDAAHAMSPMGGSGGDTAIWNAADLARTIAEEGVTKSSIMGFEARMEEKAKEKILHSIKGGQKFWRGKEWTEYNEINV